MELANMREKFNKSIDLLLLKKHDNKSFLSVEEYNKRLQEVKHSKTSLNTPGLKKVPKDYKNVRKYDVITISGKEYLIKSVKDTASNVIYYVTNEELFDVLNTCHTSIGHGGRDRMVSELKQKYCNITKEAIMTYLKLCIHCEKKSSNPKRGLVSKPILHKAFNSRAQMDLIDMQSQSFNDFRYIMNYQDHLTKFVILRPLKTKRAEEIAFNLMDIYTIFGAPAILHSDNGREFVNKIITELNEMWGDIKIVHGKPRHSQSQGSIERANRDVEDILATWMAENNSTDWPTALKFIQFQKNRAFHSGIGRSPYEAMFGCPVRLGVASVGFPSDQVVNLNTEEDIETIINSQLEKSPIDIVNQQQQNILSAREESVKCLEKQAKKMIKTSNRKLKSINVGTTVRIPIPDVDKARGSPRNLLAVVTDIQDGLYKLCTENGFLKHRYTRTEIVPCDENFLDLKETTNSAKEKEITLREAAGHNSIAGTQGYQRCHCKTKCQNNRCACRAAKKEELENTNTTFQSNDTVTYIPRRKLHFDLNLSVGDPEVDRVVVPNIPLLGFSSMLRSSPMFVNIVFNSLVEYQDSQPILDLSVKEFLWGYDDRLVKMASTVLPTWINFAKFGLLDRMLDEGTNVVTMTVPSERQTRRPYSIDNFNGSPILHQWANTDETNELNKCSLNSSSEGLLFPRHLTKDMNFPIYRKAFCRTLPLTYSSTSDMPIGYPSVYLYKFLPDVFNSSLDDNKCYCPRDGCLPAGLSDISPCYYNIPVAVSFPHFYGGDPALVDNVNGIAPNMEKHQSVVAVQPDLGIPLAVDIKIQLNLIIKATRYVNRAKKFNGLTLPICWLHLEVKSLPSSLNALLYLCFNVGPVLVKAVVALTASVGFFLVGLSVKRFGRGQQKQQHPVNGSASGDHEGGRGRGCEDDDNDDDDSGRGDDYEDDGGGAESGGLIVKRGPAAGRYRDKSYLPLHHVTVPGSSSVVVDYDHSQDYARGR